MKRDKPNSNRSGMTEFNTIAFNEIFALAKLRSLTWSLLTRGGVMEPILIAWANCLFEFAYNSILNFLVNIPIILLQTADYSSACVTQKIQLTKCLQHQWCFHVLLMSLLRAKIRSDAQLMKAARRCSRKEMCGLYLMVPFSVSVVKRESNFKQCHIALQTRLPLDYVCMPAVHSVLRITQPSAFSSC